ncbi:MAG: F0F1 ATP synthase subunit epsilon [Gammaproteobacteria bacterium]|jgi:F-type H+-transporting ATPase subunit epsilon|nr:F0F1 ATP synthase subunit epsilon [Gammaproteobacteria bacterium]
MAITMHCDIVSAEEEIFSGTVEMVFAPAEMGEVGIMPRHTPLISRLRPGEVRVQIDGKEDAFFYVSGGMLEVQPHIVTILADTAIRARDLDEAKAMEAKQHAEDILASKQTEFEEAKALAELVEAAAQLRMLQKVRAMRK